MSKNNYFGSPTNKNAHIISRVDARGNLRTETARRDPATPEFAISTDSSDTTKLFLDGVGSWGDDIVLNGREARSLYRLLRKHYGFAGKPRKG